MRINRKTIKDFSRSKYLELLPRFKEKKTQKFTTLILTLAAFSFFGFFAISPTISTITQLQKELEDNRYVNSKLEEKIKNLTLLQQKHSILKADLENTLMAAIPVGPKVSYFTGQIQAISQNTNVVLSGLQINEVELTKTLFPGVLLDDDPNNYSYFAFFIGASGSYNNIINFLSVLSSFDRIITFDNVSVSKGGNDTFRVSVRGKTYFKK